MSLKRATRSRTTFAAMWTSEFLGANSAEHPWRFHRCRSWTSCSCSLLCLVRMARQRRTPVEIPQVPFLDKLFMHVVVSGADVQTALNIRGDSTGLGQVVHARCCVWCGWPDSAEHPWRFHRCRSSTSCSCTLLCLVPMSRQRYKRVWWRYWVWSMGICFWNVCPFDNGRGRNLASRCGLSANRDGRCGAV